MTTASPQQQSKKRVIFNLPLEVVERLEAIPSGDRSTFAADALMRQLKIQGRIAWLKKFKRSGKVIPIRRDKGGWGDVKRNQY
ncbi:MAG: hypothetical protein Q8O95_03135 [bacterium]|nr:hypothetical protein [bacterium]